VPIYTDLWSLGVFMFVILQGNYPFRAKSETELFEKIKKGQFEYIHKDISERCRHVIERLIRVNPLERMSTLNMNESFWEWFMSDSNPAPLAEPTTAATNLTTYSN
jgi:serine/threonine protein kinase